MDYHKDTKNITPFSLVEIKNKNIIYYGVRLYVVFIEKDDDGLPLYYLSADKNWRENMYGPCLKHIAKQKLIGPFIDEELARI